jgi:hypothetical protein
MYREQHHEIKHLHYYHHVSGLTTLLNNNTINGTLNISGKSQLVKYNK